MILPAVRFYLPFPPLRQPVSTYDMVDLGDGAQLEDLLHPRMVEHSLHPVRSVVGLLACPEA
jgi:hypothetical protein